MKYSMVKYREIFYRRCMALTPAVEKIYEPAHDKPYKMACVPSEDSDQSGHPPSLTSLHCLHDKSLGP